MANNVSNVTVGKPALNGAVYRAPIGTTLPTDASTALDAAFVHQGYISDAGVVNSNSISTETIKAWGGDIIAMPQTEKTDTFQFTMVESLNDEVLKTRYGDDNVTGELATGLTVRANVKELPHSVWVIEQILNAGSILKRIVIADGQVTETGDIIYKDDTVIGYPVTLTAFPGGAGFGNDTHKEYLKEA